MPHQIRDVTDYHAGDALKIDVVTKNSDGTAEDISGASIDWYLKESDGDDDANAILTKSTSGDITITDAAAGQFTIKINTAETAGLSGSKFHICRLTDSAGDRATLFHGTFQISPV
jgi:hypothetical protein